MTAINPTVGPAGKTVCHAVGIAVPKSSVDRTVFVRLAVAVRVLMPADAGNVIGQNAAAVAQRHCANGNVEAAGETLDCFRPAGLIEVRHHGQPVAGRMTANPGKPASRLVDITLGGIWILDRTAHPQPSAGIEVQVHRLTDIRLRDNQFNHESIREVELLLLFIRAQRIRWGNRNRLKRSSEDKKQDN